MTKPCRSGLSLLEIITATMILALVSVAVIDGMTRSTSYAILSEAQDDLARESFEAIRQIGDDLSRSGWEFPSFVEEEYGPASGALDPVADRQRLYFPYVFQQSPDYDHASGSFTSSPALDDGLPALVPYASADDTMPDPSVYNFNHLRRDGTSVRIDGLPAHLPGDPIDLRMHFGSSGSADASMRYRDSFFARSQELIFLMAQSGTWADDPDMQDLEVLDFSGGDSGWRQPDPDEAEALFQERYSYYVNTQGLSAMEATDMAHQDVGLSLYRHDELGVLRMSDYQLNVRRDGNGEPVLDPDDALELEPVFRPAAPTGRRYIDNILVPGAWISVGRSNEVGVNIRWECLVPEDTVDVVDDPGSDAQRIALVQLREYCYAVVPSSWCFGHLVRARAVQLDNDDPEPTPSRFPRFGDWLSFDRQTRRGLVVDAIIADHVVRAVFDTYKSVDDGSLGLNEVRVRLYFAKSQADRDSQVVFRTVESVVTMRAGNNERSNQAIAEIVGDRGVAFPF